MFFIFQKISKKQAFLYSCHYTINHNEYEDKNENRSHRYDINRPWFRHEHKYSKYKKCLTIMMPICN